MVSKIICTIQLKLKCSQISYMVKKYITTYLSVNRIIHTKNFCSKTTIIFVQMNYGLFFFDTKNLNLNCYFCK